MYTFLKENIFNASLTEEEPQIDICLLCVGRSLQIYKA